MTCKLWPLQLCQNRMGKKKMSQRLNFFTLCQMDKPGAPGYLTVQQVSMCTTHSVLHCYCIESEALDFGNLK